MTDSPPPVPATETDVRGEDWYARDLTGQAFARVAFVDVDLTEALGQGTQFTDCSFRACELNAARFTDAAFVNCAFTNCTFFDARLTGCKLVGSAFVRCTLDLLRVERVDWSFVGLAGADLRRA